MCLDVVEVKPDLKNMEAFWFFSDHAGNPDAGEDRLVTNDDAHLRLFKCVL